MSERNLRDTSMDAKLTNERSYWLNKLSGDTQLSSFPIDNFHQKVHHCNVSGSNYKLSEATSSRLIAMSNKSDYALYMILLSGVKYLLHKYLRGEDIIVVMPVFKQNVDADKLINRILPLRLQVDNKNNFKEFLQEIKKVVMEANANQNFSIINLLSSLNTELSDNNLPILNTIVLLDNIHDKKYIGDMQSDMLISFSRNTNSIEVNVEYNSLLYKEDTVKYLTRYLGNYFNIIVDNPNIKLSEISIMSEGEKNNIIENTASENTKYFNLGRKAETTIDDILRNLTGRKAKCSSAFEGEINKYILDENNEIQPAAVIGELCIEVNDLERLGMAKENLKLNEISLKSTILNKKLYKTQCLARWINDNEIEYIGRADQLISIRGCRVNLNEIEMLLLQRDDISEIKVIQRQGKNGRKYVCAYIKSDSDIDNTDLKKYMSEIVPDYMIPNYFIKLDNMPLNVDGTLNINELPSPNKGINEESAIKEIQLKLLEIWKKVLELDDINLDDDFFDIGGQSILAIKLEVEIEKNGMQLLSSEIYNCRTIREQATKIWDNM